MAYLVCGSGFSLSLEGYHMISWYVPLVREGGREKEGGRRREGGREGGERDRVKEGKE